MTPAQLIDPAVVYGFVAATLMTHVLKQCGDDLSRDNIPTPGDEHQGFRAANGSSRHEDQHVTRELLSDSTDATFKI